MRGLWRGASATVGRAALLSAANLASYVRPCGAGAGGGWRRPHRPQDHTKVTLRRKGWMEEGAALHLAAGGVSGLAAMLASNPADVIKSRMMVGGGARQGLLAVAAAIWRAEGPAGFYRGFWPAYARAGPTFFIQMPLNEALRAALGVGHV